MTQKTTIGVCTGPRCTQKLSHYTLERAKNECVFSKKENEIAIEECGCQGNCEKGPTIIIRQGENREQKSFVSPLEISKIIKRL